MVRLILSFSILIIGASFARADSVKVLSSVNAIREECRFFSPAIAKVNYDDELNLLDEKGDWYWVDFYGMEGCIHNSAIKERKVALTDIQVSDQQKATYDEITLAGKGFFAELYKFNNPNVKFGTLEAIESFEVSDEKLRVFAEDGSLHLP